MTKKVEVKATKKVVAKKVTVKTSGKVETKEQIKAKKVGKNLVVIIGKTQHVLPNATKAQIDKISTKVVTFNKSNSETRKNDILQLLKTEATKEKETKVTKAKGVKAVIKKVVKTTKKSEAPVDLIAKMKEDLASGAIGKGDVQDKIKELQALIAEEQKNQTQSSIGTDNGRSRERY